jgi:hypothetical protein
MQIRDVVTPAVYEVKSHHQYESSALVVLSTRRYRLTTSRYWAAGQEEPIVEAEEGARPGRDSSGNRGYCVGLLALQVPWHLVKILQSEALDDPQFNPVMHPEVAKLVSAAEAFTFPLNAAVAEPAVTVVPTRDLIGELAERTRLVAEQACQRIQERRRQNEVEGAARHRHIVVFERAARLGAAVRRSYEYSGWLYPTLSVGDLEKLLDLAERARVDEWPTDG